MQPVAWRCSDLGLNPNDVRRKVWYHAPRQREKVSMSKLKHLNLGNEGLQGRFQPTVFDFLFEKSQRYTKAEPFDVHGGVGP